MSLLTWLKYQWNPPKICDSFEVVLSLSTPAIRGYANVSRIIPIERKIYSEDYNYSPDYLKFIKEIEQENDAKLQNLSEECLKKCRTKKLFKDESNGCLYGGEHIICCTWNIRPNFREMTYKEFKEWKNGNN
jgi:hypothetical protein